MKIVTRYLCSEIYTSMLGISIVLLGVFLSNFLVRFMRAAANAVLASGLVKILVLLQIPILATVLLPAALFLGILFAYGRLYADNEMMILAISGMTKRRLLTLTLGFALPIILVVSLLSLWISPKIYKYSDHIASGAVSHKLELLKANYFNEIPGGKWVFYAKSYDAKMRKFYDVFITERPSAPTRDWLSSSVLIAKNAYQKMDTESGDLYIVLEDGYRYVGVPGKRDFEVTKYSEYGIRMQQEEMIWYRDSSSKTTVQLWQERHSNSAAAELVWRISLSLAALLLTIMAVPLSVVRPQQGRYAKFAPAILLYIFYANFLFLAKAWIKRGVLKPLLGLCGVHGFMLLVVIFLLSRYFGWWRWDGFREGTKSLLMRT